MSANNDNTTQAKSTAAATQSDGTGSSGRLRSWLADWRSYIEFFAIILAATALIMESRSNDEANQLEGALLELEIVTAQEHKDNYTKAHKAFFSAVQTTNYWRGAQDLWVWITPDNRLRIADTADGPPQVDVDVKDGGAYFDHMLTYTKVLQICGAVGRCKSYFASPSSHGCDVINDTLVAQRFISSIVRLNEGGALESGRLKVSGKTRDQNWWQLRDYSLSRQYDALCGDKS